MRTTIRNASVLLAVATLSGCYADLEDKSVVYKQSLPVCDKGGTSCSFQGIRIPPQLEDFIPIGITGSAEFTLDLGDQDLLKPENDLGPATFDNTLMLNKATLTMATAGPNFDGIEAMRLREVKQGSCTPGACTPPNCQDVGRYTRDPAAPRPITEIVLQGDSSINMIDLMSNGKLTLCVVARGRPPEQNWRADATLDLWYKAHAGM